MSVVPRIPSSKLLNNGDESKKQKNSVLRSRNQRNIAVFAIKYMFDFRLAKVKYVNYNEKAITLKT